jgi:hypothetical protein
MLGAINNEGVAGLGWTIENGYPPKGNKRHHGGITEWQSMRCTFH